MLAGIALKPARIAVHVVDPKRPPQLGKYLLRPEHRLVPLSPVGMLIVIALFLNLLGEQERVVVEVDALSGHHPVVYPAQFSQATTQIVEIGRASCRETSVSVRVDLGGRSIFKKKNQNIY